MTDDLDELKALLDKATPTPDQTRRVENITLAEKNFADLQGSVNEARPIHNRPITGLWRGAKSMLNTLTSRAGLTASTALVAVALVVTVPFDDLTKDVSKPAPRLTDENTPVMSRETQEVADGADVSGVTAGRQVELEPIAEVVDQMASSPEDDNLGALPQELPVAPDVSMAQPTAKSRPFALNRSASQESEPAPSVASSAEMEQAERLATATVQTAEFAEMSLDEAPPVFEEANTETFSNEDANPLKITAEDPVSTFSIDVDTASYSIIRNFLMRGQLPPADAVRIEEMVNYFTYDYAAPEPGSAFRPTISVSQTPWNPGTQLVEIGIQGELPQTDARPPLNLVFLIDTSGSMNDPAKLPLLKQSFRLMLSQLRPEDEVAIVTYAGSAGEILAPTNAGERSTILAALERLGAGGSTAGQAGIEQAYATAETMAKEGEVNRVILATDGDFNVGIHDPEMLKDYIADKRESGTYLSVLGFGRGNLDDATMQALAQNGNGQAAYIDTLQEAQKVLVDQLSGALFPIANDVKIQVEFNPAEIAEYRLIGYETRALRREDFNNDKVDAGDIGAGHQVTALYEVTPVASDARLTEPLRYGTAPETEGNGELGFLRLRHKAPGASESQLIETPIMRREADQPGFAAAIAGFGQLLRDSAYLGDWSYEEAIALAQQNKGDDPFGYRAEAIRLMKLAQSLSD